MYRITCMPATLGNQTFKSYWCAGKQWFCGKAVKVADADMTPEMLHALETDPMGRIVVEHDEDGEAVKPTKPSAKAEKPKAEAKPEAKPEVTSAE